MRHRPSQIIAICGGSGSGKSTLAHKFVGATVLSTDHFYKDIADLVPREDGTYDFDHPSAVDLQECAEACLKLAEGDDITVPVYDMRSCKRVGTQAMPASPTKIVVVEGSLPLQSIRLRSGSSPDISVQLEGARLQHSLARENGIMNLRLQNALALTPGKKLTIVS